MGKLLHCPCVNEKYCGTMIGSIKLHRLMYDTKFREFIHSPKGLKHLLEHYSNISVSDAIHNAYNDLK